MRITVLFFGEEGGGEAAPPSPNATADRRAGDAEARPDAKIAEGPRAGDSILPKGGFKITPALATTSALSSTVRTRDTTYTEHSFCQSGLLVLESLGGRTSPASLKARSATQRYTSFFISLLASRPRSIVQALSEVGARSMCAAEPYLCGIFFSILWRGPRDISAVNCYTLFKTNIHRHTHTHTKHIFFSASLDSQARVPFHTHIFIFDNS